MSVSWFSDIETVKEFPSVLPATHFDPLSDVSALRAAMKGFGTDEHALIDILCQRSNDQRQSIMELYGRIVTRPLIADLKSELSGNFKHVMVGLMFPTNFYCAKQLHKAMKGIVRTKEDVLVEILCSRPYEEIEKIAAAYQSSYGTALIEDVKKGTSGTFRQLLIMTLQKMTDQSNGFGDCAYDPVKAKEKAKILYKGERKIETNVNVFLDIFGFAVQRRRQVTIIFHEYEKISGKTIEQLMKSKLSGAVLNGLLTIVKTIRNRPAYFAERLKIAISGWGMDNDTLIRIILSRCEIDLTNIMYEYECMYGKALFDAVKEDTSGYYRRSLLTLLGIEPLVRMNSSSCSSCNVSCV
ncbi:annexin A4-like [Daphnia carinata]|uniref:annexin A4-like n=1 Tax=Daphnia carinata TaxID=120202 RepID=UPI00257FBE71|nr:annexin A4-like [Daphnia carinata]